LCPRRTRGHREPVDGHRARRAREHGISYANEAGTTPG